MRTRIEQKREYARVRTLVGRKKEDDSFEYDKHSVVRYPTQRLSFGFAQRRQGEDPRRSMYLRRRRVRTHYAGVRWAIGSSFVSRGRSRPGDCFFLLLLRNDARRDDACLQSSPIGTRESTTDTPRLRLRFFSILLCLCLVVCHLV